MEPSRIGFRRGFALDIANINISFKWWRNLGHAFIRANLKCCYNLSPCTPYARHIHQHIPPGPNGSQCDPTDIAYLLGKIGVYKFCVKEDGHQFSNSYIYIYNMFVVYFHVFPSISVMDGHLPHQSGLESVGLSARCLNFLDLTGCSKLWLPT